MLLLLFMVKKGWNLSIRLERKRSSETEREREQCETRKKEQSRWYVRTPKRFAPTPTMGIDKIYNACESI